MSYRLRYATFFERDGCLAIVFVNLWLAFRCGRLRARQRLASAGTIARSVRARISQAQAPHVRQAVLKPAFARPLEFMAVVTGNGECARMVEDGFHAIPIRLLGM